MNVIVREFGAGPAWPRGDGGQASSVLVLAGPPPVEVFEPGFGPIVSADLLIDGGVIARVARDPGPPAPLLPPVPTQKAAVLAEALRARGLPIEVHRAGSWGRLLATASTEDGPLTDAREATLQFVLRGGIWESERSGLEVVLREMIQNAAHHGNGNRPEALISIDALVSGASLRLAVTDEGRGFAPPSTAKGQGADPVQVAVARAQSRFEQGDRGGLGIALITAWADRLHYQDGGRCCVVEKDLPPVR